MLLRPCERVSSQMWFFLIWLCPNATDLLFYKVYVTKGLQRGRGLLLSPIKATIPNAQKQKSSDVIAMLSKQLPFPRKLLLLWEKRWRKNVGNTGALVHSAH